MADEIKIIAKIVTDDKQAKVKAQQTGKQIATKVDQGAKGAKVGENINKSLDKVKKNTFADAIKGKLQDVKRGIQAIGVGGDKLTKIGDFFQGGAIAAFAAIAMAAGAVLVKMWEDATESAEEYFDRMHKNQQYLEKEIKATQDEAKGAKDLFQRLEEINNLQNLSNANKAEAAILVEAITKRYGDVGIQIDKNTGKIKNLREIQLKALDEQYKKELRLKQLKNQSFVGRGGSAHVAASALGREIGDKTSYNQTGYVTDQGLIDSGFYGSMEKALNMGLDVRFNEETYTRTTAINGVIKTFEFDLSEQQKKIGKLWNSGLKGKKQAIPLMRNLYKGNAKIQSLLDAWERQLDGAIAAVQSLQAFKATGSPSQQLFNEKIIAKGKEIVTEQNRDEEASRSAEEARRKAMQQNQYSKLSTEQKLQWQRKRNQEENKNIKKLTAEYDELEAQVQESGKNLLKIQKSGDKIALQQAQKQYLKLLKKRNQAGANLDRALADEQTSRFEIEKLEQQIKKQQEKSKKYYADKKADDEFQLKYQKLILQGKFQEAEQLKIINDLKKQGLQIDEKAVKDMVKRNRDLFNLQKQKSLVDMGQGLISQHGSSQEKLLQEYKKLTQGITDEGLKADYWKLLKLREGLTNLPDVEAYQMQSSQLTKRGGFQTGYVDNADRINRQIATNTKQTNDYLQQIKQITQKNGSY